MDIIMTLNDKLLIKLVGKEESAPTGFSGSTTGTTEYLKGIVILEADTEYVCEGDIVYFPKNAGQKIDTSLFSDIKCINPVNEYMFLECKLVSLIDKVDS